VVISLGSLKKNMMIDLNNHRLKLEYPCSWKYKIILLKTVNINVISKDIFGDREHTFSQSNVSKKDKFRSYNIELIVYNDDDRKELHHLLSKHKDIKMVL